MHIDGSIAKYEHPYVATDGVLFRVKDGDLQVKLVYNPDVGTWCLPGGFVPVDRRAEDVLREKMLSKAGVSGFYAEQLQTYDDPGRDWRGRVVSIAYLCLTGDMSDSEGWYVLDEKLGMLYGTDGDSSRIIDLHTLGFDHGLILLDARQRLVNKLWYSDLPKYLLPDTFRIAEIQALYERLEGSRYYTNFKRNMGPRISPVTLDAAAAPGRKAMLFRWAGVAACGEGGK